MLTAMRQLLDATKALLGDFAVYDLRDMLERADADLYIEVLHDLDTLRLAVTDAEVALHRELMR